MISFGLVRTTEGEENEWKYLNQAADCPPVYTNWFDGEPNDRTVSKEEDCIVLMDDLNGMADTSWTDSWFVMCEMTIRK